MNLAEARSKKLWSAQFSESRFDTCQKEIIHLLIWSKSGKR